MNEFVKVTIVDEDDPSVNIPALLSLKDITNVFGYPSRPDISIILRSDGDEIQVKHTFDEICNMLESVGYVLTP